MTYAPRALLDVRAYMRPITGLPDSALGIAPDPEHNGGYHCGWDRRRIVNGVLDDYSWQESARDSSHRTDAASAFDLGTFGRLREFSVWLVRECAAGAPDTLDIREVIYSPDGQVVKRWDRLGRRTSGDSSHLTHTHISFFRDAEGRPKLPVFRRYFGMEQTDALVNPTGGPRTVGQMYADVQNLRNAFIGDGAVVLGPDGTPIPGWPKAGSPLDNMARMAGWMAELRAAAAADQTRDAATLAAIQALAAGGTSVDTAAVIARIQSEAAATRALVEQHHQAEMAALTREHDAEVAGLQAELDRLKAA